MKSHIKKFNESVAQQCKEPIILAALIVAFAIILSTIIYTINTRYSVVSLNQVTAIKINKITGSMEYLDVGKMIREETTQ